MDALHFDAAGVTFVLGMTGIVKSFLPEKFQKDSVLVSCALGVLYAVSLRPGKAEIIRNVTVGIMIGLSASGGYAGMKNFVENREKAALPK